MKKNLLATLVVLGLLLTGCSKEQSLGGATVTANSIASSQNLTESSNIKSEDTDTNYDESSTAVTLNGNTILVDGSGAASNGNILTISKAGTYIISGTLNDGQILINASKDDTVHLILNGANITNKSGAPIYASQCDKLIVTLKDKTNNTITDGGDNFKYANETDKEPNAALFSKDDLSINGTGSLTVNATFNNGIGTKDDLVITSGNFKINSKDHGIRGNDSITILDGEFNITSGSDGIQTNNTEDKTKGWIFIENGKFNITSTNDGIQADTTLTILNGDFNIKSGGGSNGKAAESSESYKGIKASGDMIINGGEFTIDSLDDSVHSNSNVTISGGNFKLSTADDAVHADKDLTVNGGEINISTCYEGLEGYNVIISDGNINLNSSNDGINASGEGDSKGSPGGTKNSSSEACYIKISGGNITVLAEEDGLDSNGAINISGGYVVSLVNLNGNTGGNAAIDPDGDVTVTGGTLIYGGTVSGKNPSGSSTQSYVYTDNKIKAGTEVTLKKDGNTIASFTPTIDCATLVISSKDVKASESYDLYNGTNLIGTITAGVGGGMQGGGPGGGGMKGGRR